MPTTSVSASGAGSESCSSSTATAMSKVKTNRSESIATIARLRSTRSVITPAGRVNTSHGKRCATATSAISNGLRVIAVASHG